MTGTRPETWDAWTDSVRRVVGAIRAAPATPPSPQEMARIAMLSEYHLIRVFTRVTGLTPGRFLAATRLSEATRLLATSDLSVSAICDRVGYVSVTSFTTAFTRDVGISPKLVRRLAAGHRPVDPDRVCAALSPGQAGPGGADGPGEVLAEPRYTSLIVIGGFPAPLARGHPATCAARVGPGPYRLGRAPDGRYHLLALGLPPGGDLAACLAAIATRDLLVGTAPGAVTIRADRTYGDLTIQLRPMVPTDPPVITAVPALITALSLE